MRPRAVYVRSRNHETNIRWTFRSHEGPVGDMLDNYSRRTLTAARRFVGVQTGTLLLTGRREKGQGQSGPWVDVTFGRRGLTDYLGWHHDGFPPHIIRPRRKQALRFVHRGRIVFAKSVRHPGYAGSRFLTRALDTLR